MSFRGACSCRRSTWNSPSEREGKSYSFSSRITLSHTQSSAWTLTWFMHPEWPRLESFKESSFRLLFFFSFFLTRSALFVSKKSYMGKFYSLSKIFVSFSFLCSHVLHTCLYKCFTYMHVCVYQMFSWYPQRAEESIKSSTSWVINNCEPPCGYQELYSGPLQAQPVFLTSKSCLCPPKISFTYSVCVHREFNIKNRLIFNTLI